MACAAVSVHAVKMRFNVFLFFRFVVKIERNSTLTANQRLVLQPVSSDNVMRQKTSGPQSYAHIAWAQISRAQCIETLKD